MDELSNSENPTHSRKFTKRKFKLTFLFDSMLLFTSLSQQKGKHIDLHIGRKVKLIAYLGKARVQANYERSLKSGARHN